MNYDIIGDVHGQADKLEALLKRLGYSVRSGAWRKARHTAVFVGDLIDRGPGQLRTLELVRNMVDAGSALATMGNHEFNAIGWATPHPTITGQHLRLRSDKRQEDHQAFLSEIGSDSTLHHSWIEWLRTLPLWLELPGIRVVHAFWDEKSLSLLRAACGPGHVLTDQLLVDAHDKTRPEYDAIENVLKGLEIPLPIGQTFPDKSGEQRCRARVRWWHTGTDKLEELALGMDDHLHTVRDIRIEPQSIPGYAHPTPVFCGHYWMTGTPQPQTPKVACVDYSAGKDGALVAYRWEGEDTLSAASFVTSHDAVSGREQFL